MKKVLILYTSVGEGHKSMAENIGFHLQSFGLEVKLSDMRKVQAGKFEKYVVAVHQFINRHLPFVWGWLYSWGHYIIYPFRVFIAGFNYQQTKALIDEYRPDLVIATQTTASAVVSFLKNKKFYTGKFGISFSDFHIHPYWIYKQADFYILNIPEQKQPLVKRGVKPENVFVCGMLIKPHVEVNKEAVRQKLGILPDEKVVLVGTGSLGIGFNLDDLKEVMGLENTKVVFATGKNTELYENLRQMNSPRLIPLPFYRPMDELYAISDVLISKPGGMTTSETLSWHLPMIVTFTLPGQEEINYDYLLERKLILGKGQNLAATVRKELATGAQRKQLEANEFVPGIVGSPAELRKAVESALEIKLDQKVSLS